MSDRIEAAPDVRELVEQVRDSAPMVRNLGSPFTVVARLMLDAATAPTTLSAKCAEQAAEIERLGAQVVDAESSWLRIASRERARAEQAEADNARLLQREAVLVAALETIRDEAKRPTARHIHLKKCAIVQANAGLSSIRDGKQGEARHAT